MCMIAAKVGVLLKTQPKWVNKIQINKKKGTRFIFCLTLGIQNKQFAVLIFIVPFLLFNLNNLNKPSFT